MKKYAVFTGLSLFIFAADQWSKVLICAHLRWSETISIIDGIFSFTYVRNTGAAFGLFRSAPRWFHDPFFIALPVGVLFFILLVLAALPERQKGSAWALGLVFGGAIGNLLDRIRLGYVVDFLDFYWNGYHWPAFNIADSAVVVGIMILSAVSFFSSFQRQELKRLSDL